MNIIEECMICGIRPGIFICKSCGMSVCEDCFDRAKKVCRDCSSFYKDKEE
ncbi:MAG: hypothetical protein NTV63_05085 [Candidatus Woesearchaeota archaeon]|nr:hypothetical protein [Candidatus Woesearchaeota archaeon]